MLSPAALESASTRYIWLAGDRITAAMSSAFMTNFTGPFSGGRSGSWWGFDGGAGAGGAEGVWGPRSGAPGRGAGVSGSGRVPGLGG
ncbi:hypothetical protein GCM10009712_44220 [Pseudarthrobacter sulfonivorans]